jgi:hypothetical protein
MTLSTMAMPTMTVYFAAPDEWDHPPKNFFTRLEEDYSGTRSARNQTDYSQHVVVRWSCEETLGSIHKRLENITMSRRGR